MQEDAILECNYTVLYADVNNDLVMTDVALLKYLQEGGGLQTKKVFGSILTPKGAWILLSWKVKKFASLKWSDKFSIKTWPAKHTGPFSIRNYEVYNESGKLITIASTRWVIMDFVTKQLVKNIDDVVDKYTEYNKMLFDEETVKLKEPKELECNFKYVVQRKDIDTNKHVNNVKYLEMAYEALPENIYNSNDFSNIEIMYKHSAFLGEELSIGFQKNELENGKIEYLIVIKSSDKLNAIIKLY